MENTRVVKVAGAKVTTIDTLTMRHRNQLRRVYRVAVEAGAEPATATEFVTIVIKTVQVDGDLWKPPSATAPDNEIKAALEFMLDNVPPEIVEEWITAIATKEDDPVTGPTAPTDPNA